MGNHSEGKVKSDKVYTRAQAIKAMKNGADPSQFLNMDDPYRMPDPKNPSVKANAKNYHTRQYAWKMLGRPMPFEGAEKAKFLKSIHVKDDSVVVETTEEKASE